LLFTPAAGTDCDKKVWDGILKEGVYKKIIQINLVQYKKNIRKLGESISRACGRQHPGTPVNPPLHHSQKKEY